MSNYTVEDLITRWKREELTVEQMIGQMLLVLKDHELRLRAASRQPPNSSPAAPAQDQRQR